MCFSPHGSVPGDDGPLAYLKGTDPERVILVPEFFHSPARDITRTPGILFDRHTPYSRSDEKPHYPSGDQV